jgi:hypothetical protein
LPPEPSTAAPPPAKKDKMAGKTSKRERRAKSALAPAPVPQPEAAPAD